MTSNIAEDLNNDVALCNSCNKEFYSNEVKYVQHKEVCPHCNSEEWAFKEGTNLINCDIELSLECFKGITVSQIREKIVNDILEALKKYRCVDVKLTESNVAHIPF